MFKKYSRAPFYIVVFLICSALLIMDSVFASIMQNNKKIKHPMNNYYEKYNKKRIKDNKHKESSARCSALQMSYDKNVADEIKFLFDNPPIVETRYAALMDYNSGIFLYEKNSNVKIVPSSMTKMMTTYVVFKLLKEKRINENDMLDVSEKAWKTGGTKMFLAVNSKVSVKDLLLGVIVQSGNDACITLAEGIAGSEEAFVGEMNLQAKRLGMVNTKFLNVTGLFQEGHFSTTHDLAILGRSLIKDFPEYYSIYSRKEFTYHNIKQSNRNTMLGENGVDGIKTGYTDEGGYGITTSAVVNGRRLISVVNGLCSNKARVSDSMKLLGYGFNKSKSIVFYKANQVIANVDVEYGSNFSVPIAAKNDVQIVVPYQGISGIDPTLIDLKVSYSNNITAPVAENHELGKIKIFVRDNMIQEIPLYTLKSVGRANFVQHLVQNIEKIFFKKSIYS